MKVFCCLYINVSISTATDIIMCQAYISLTVYSASSPRIAIFRRKMEESHLEQ